jgi:hypothetical protein
MRKRTKRIHGTDVGIKCGTDGDKMCLLMNEFFSALFYAPNANEVLEYAKFGCWSFLAKIR